MTAEGTVRLDGANTTLIFATETGLAARLIYWGASLPPTIPAGILPDPNDHPVPPASLDEPRVLSLVPGFGLGWFGEPGILGHDDIGGTWALDPRVRSVTRDDTDATASVVIDLYDPIARIAIRITVAMNRKTGVIAFQARVDNEGDRPYWLTRAAPAVLAVPEQCCEALTFGGRWAGEFAETRQRVAAPMALVREVWRGRPGHGGSPTLILGEPGFSEQGGRVYGFHLAWSGNSRLVAEPVDHGAIAVTLAPALAPGECLLAPGESFETPRLLSAYSDSGMNALSAVFHEEFRSRRISRNGAMTPRPVQFNTWEAVYLDTDAAVLLCLAERAAALGVERFVVDDGWFTNRTTVAGGLGDWVEDPTKLPGGLEEVAECVTRLGMAFGLWVEPEMVSEASDLYRTHPDWCLHLPGRGRPTARHQLVLDLTRQEVCDYLFDRLDALCRRLPIRYFKWDMNRDLVPAASARTRHGSRARAGDQDVGGPPVFDRQVRGLYSLLERLRRAHPDVEIEACASGGGRVDAGILDYSERFWISDNNDPAARLDIQRGFTRIFPLETMGAHIGPSPAHITGLGHGIGFTAAVALPGHLGLELDVRALDDAERKLLAAWIAFYKDWRQVLHDGRLHRLDGAGSGRDAAMVVARGGERALAWMVQMSAPSAARPAPVRLAGLESGAGYRVASCLVSDSEGASGPAFTTWSQPLGGALAMTAGVMPPFQRPETAWMVSLERL